MHSGTKNVHAWWLPRPVLACKKSTTVKSIEELDAVPTTGNTFANQTTLSYFQGWFWLPQHSVLMALHQIHMSIDLPICMRLDEYFPGNMEELNDFMSPVNIIPTNAHTQLPKISIAFILLGIWMMKFFHSLFRNGKQCGAPLGSHELLLPLCKYCLSLLYLYVLGNAYTL